MAGKDGVEEKKFPPPTNSYRPRCFFDIHINKVEAGRLIFELFPDICPKTCENFRALTTGEKGEGKTTSKPLHYKNTVLHRIVKGFIIQGGDFTAGDGTGGESIYGGTFKDENFELKHDRPFLLSMANCGANTNGSQFFITLAAAPHLDNVHTVFGHILFGQEIVRDMENQKVNSNHKPYADIRVSHCGELIKKTKIVNKKQSKSEEKMSSSDSSSSSDSDSNHHRKKSRKREKSKERKKSVVKEKETEKENLNSSKNEGKAKEPLDGDLNFIPTVPSTFLMRRSRTPTPVRERRRKEGMNDARKREPVLRTRVNMVSKSGKKLRGRGVMRYRTPTPDSSTNAESDEEPTPEDASGDKAANEQDERLSEKSKRSNHQKAEDVGKSLDNQQRQSRSNEKPKLPSRSRVKVRSRSRSRDRARSRSRDRRRRSRVRRRSRERRRSRSRSRSVGRYRRRSRSFERRRPRYNRRSRSRSRRRSRDRSQSPDRKRSPRNTSHERKGKFERHRSKSGSRSDSSQERKKKSLKEKEKKVEKPVADKSSIKEKIDKLFQKKEEENKAAALAAAAAAESAAKADDERKDDDSFTVIDKSPLDINELLNQESVSQKLYHPPADRNGNSSSNLQTNSDKLPPSPSPPPSQPLFAKPVDDHYRSDVKVDDHYHSDLKESVLSKQGKVLSFPTGIDEKSSIVSQRNVCSDDYIATSIEEENISGYLFETKDKIDPISSISESQFADTGSRDPDLTNKNRKVDVGTVKTSDVNESGGKEHHSIDEIIKSKGKIDELQEQIREFKEYKQQFSEKIDFSAILNNHKKKVENGLSDKEGKVSKPKVKREEKVDSDSQSYSDDSRKATNEKKKLKKINKRHSYLENGKNDADGDGDDDDGDDESDDNDKSKVSKKKSKKRKDDSSSDMSDVDHRKKKSRRKHDSRKSRKRRRNEHSSSSSQSDSDSETEHKAADSHHSEKPTDADEESTVEADRDRKKNKKGKHKRKRTALERSHNSDEENTSKRRKQKHKTKRHDSDYSSDDSEEDRKRRSKRKRRKKRVSDSSSEDSSDDEYEHSRKRKLKSYDKKRDRKRKKKRNSIST